jgi:SAM-dependent methyltransferase
MISGLLEDIIFHLSMRAHTGHPRGDLSHRKATFSTDAYSVWRTDSLRSQFETYFSPQMLDGKRVLDFGCGSGQLSFYAKEKGANDVVGTDLSAKSVHFAIKLREKEHLECRFILESNPKCISLPDSSIDIILCFDVMEHVMDYREVIKEWLRVLSPGGRVLLWWSVWWHPYGHHLHTMIPLPWVHTFMSDTSLFRVCARIYDNPEFQPRHWHFDENGQRKPNPYAGTVSCKDLNKLTIRQFDRISTGVGFQTIRKQVNPFTGTRLAVLKRALARGPWADFFCSCVVYELRKPA